MSSSRPPLTAMKALFVSNIPLSQQAVANLYGTSRFFNFFGSVNGLGGTYRLMPGNIMRLAANEENPCFLQC